MTQRDPADIVILGASYAGISIAHQLLRTIYDDLRVVQNAPKYRVVLVSPNTSLHWHNGTAQALCSESEVDIDRCFIPFIKSFEVYDDNQFLFVHGEAVWIDFGQKIVEIKTYSTTRSSFEDRRITVTKKGFHALVIATGTSANSKILSLHGHQDQTRKVLKQFRTNLISARSCVIVGGGLTGVEFAGQIATWARHAHSDRQRALSTCFQGARGKSHNEDNAHFENDQDQATPISNPAVVSRPLEVILITGGPRLLGRMSPNIGRKAEKLLQTLGVRIVNGTRLIAAQELPSRVTKCVLSDDISLTCDLFIAATGATPNTDFIASTFKCSRGFIVVNQETLRVPRAGVCVFAVGSCASLNNTSLHDIFDSVSVLLHNLKNDLVEQELRMQSPQSILELKVTIPKDKIFSSKIAWMQTISVSPHAGIATIRGHVIPCSLHWTHRHRRHGLELASRIVQYGQL